MGAPSTSASNAIIYCTYAVFLVIGCYIAWRLRHQSKTEWLSSNRTQKGQTTKHRADVYVAIPLALNFIAAGDPTTLRSAAAASALSRSARSTRDCSKQSGRLPFMGSSLGSGILTTYPQIATIAGVQGLVVYALSSALPLLIFGVLGPIIRRKCPEGFVLTEWCRQRYGFIGGLFLSICTLITMFLYMVAELSAVQQIVNVLTGLDGLPVVIVQCAVTTIYTGLAGFKVSFITDNIQGGMVLGLIIMAVIAVGVETKVEHRLIEESGYLNASLLGWQLIYILPVAILTNDFFLSGFWLRTFAAKTDKDLRIGVSIASFVVCCILVLVGVGGLLAAWSGAWKLNDAENGYLAFFFLLNELPAWVVGVVLVMVIALSTAAFDSFQSAIISTASNDIFRNKLNIWVIRGLVVALIVPTVVVALKSPDILQIFLISDLVSAAVVPCLVFGLSERFYWYRGFDFVIGGLGGIFTVFLFGLVYYDGNVDLASKLLILENGLYAGDWSAFGAFVAAPVGGVLWAFGAAGVRIGFLYVMSRVKGHRFSALDRPIPQPRTESVDEQETERVIEQSDYFYKSGKFF
ncbi:hypothetical protein BU24DRAFT_339614 [Aaosphaeria arxii CBS 175.79]|uniref:Urea transporter n=1 Tax=Aaosphaeria arxii CBS 175.79 TaxID=1450172 RepID=A0A6A5YBM0_9PLEO|nr:uncharacterized protein BU24DRAFT_339614 [Aaosphaeria arxii CBS 175.79]KAF2022080.1 hypothetical protein BU24DRAFT_339614 [Aaosphaeria arxii CBS 175.79]